MFNKIKGTFKTYEVSQKIPAYFYYSLLHKISKAIYQTADSGKIGLFFRDKNHLSAFFLPLRSNF